MATSLPRDATALLLSGGCRELRRRLPPLPWMVLEEVALDAVDDDGRIVAATSARRIADQLGIDPGTAARALRVLRDAGVLTFDQPTATAGRFGLSSYALADVPGFRLVEASVDQPRTAKPHTVEPHAVMAGAVSPSAEPAAPSASTGSSAALASAGYETVRRTSRRRPGRVRREAANPGSPAQLPLDLRATP
jgi:hypothetical protein